MRNGTSFMPAERRPTAAQAVPKYQAPPTRQDQNAAKRKAFLEQWLGTDIDKSDSRHKVLQKALDFMLDDTTYGEHAIQDPRANRTSRFYWFCKTASGWEYTGFEDRSSSRPQLDQGNGGVRMNSRAAGSHNTPQRSQNGPSAPPGSRRSAATVSAHNVCGTRTTNPIQPVPEVHKRRPAYERQVSWIQKMVEAVIVRDRNRFRPS